MRVLCINHDSFGHAVIPYGPNDPKIGDECKVINSVIGYDNAGSECSCFELEGYDQWYYDQRNFAPLSDLDETELVTEEFEEKYCTPVNS